MYLVSIANNSPDTYSCSISPRGTDLTISGGSNDRIITLEHVYSAVVKEVLVLLEIIARFGHRAWMTAANHENLTSTTCWIEA